MCTNCDQPNQNCANPCSNCGGCVCTCSSLYDTVGCVNITSSDCVKYLGTSDLSCIGVKRNDTFTSVIQSLSTYSTGILGKVVSSSLLLTRTGSCLDNLSLELVPSTSPGNILGYGSDGRPYVPKTDLNIVSTTCLSWQKTTSGQVITYVPVIDWNCVSQQTCPLCSNPAPCTAPTGLIVSSVGQTTAQVGWNMIAGVTYDVLVNGVTQSTNVTSPYTFNSLIANTTYSLTVRAKCSSGLTADTPISVTTLPITSCVLPSSLVVAITAGTAQLTWTAGGGGGTQLVEYKLNSGTTYTTFGSFPATTATASIPGITPNLLYNFRVTNNCSGGAASQASISGAQISCLTIGTVVTDTTVAATITPPGGDIDTIVITLYDSTGTTTLQHQTFLSPFDTSITATFPGLTASTTYQVGVVQSLKGITNTSCTKVTVTTTTVPGCPLPTNLTVTLS